MNTIDAKLLARMFLAGAKNLEVKRVDQRVKRVSGTGW